MNRAECLSKVGEIILNDRNATHGEPENSFATIAAFWTTYKGVTFQPHDVAAMMVLLKLARIKENPLHTDSWLDSCGYSAIGPELLKTDA